jgi:Trk K+ transport system NAD-binding subunit
VAIALAVAASFALASALNTQGHALYARFEPWLLRLQSDQRHPDDSPLSLAGADLMIMGIGRLGLGAYLHLAECGHRPIGLDSDPIKVRRQEEEGRRVLYADAEDPDFWQRLDLRGVRAVLLALPDLDSKCLAARELRRTGFRGLIAATNAFTDEVAALEAADVDEAFNHYETAGDSFARRSRDRLELEESNDPDRV